MSNDNVITYDDLMDMQHEAICAMMEARIEREETLRELAEVGIDWSAGE